MDDYVLSYFVIEGKIVAQKRNNKGQSKNVISLNLPFSDPVSIEAIRQSLIFR